MPENTFDIVSKIDLQEVSNAIQQAMKEVHHPLRPEGLEVEDRAGRQGRHHSAFGRRVQTEGGERNSAAETGEAWRLAEGPDLRPRSNRRRAARRKQKITMQQGIAIEKAREIVKLIKDSKKKVQASIQGDLVRVSGKDRDTLQEIIALLKRQDFGIDMQFTNYRTN